MTEKLARAAAAHPWRTVTAWLVAIVAAVVLIGGLLGDRLTSEGRVTNNPESLRGYDLIERHFPPRDFSTELVVVRSERRNHHRPL